MSQRHQSKPSPAKRSKKVEGNGDDNKVITTSDKIPRNLFVVACYNLTELPVELLEVIFLILPPEEICRTRRVCKLFNTICRKRELWEKINKLRFGVYLTPYSVYGPKEVKRNNSLRDYPLRNTPERTNHLDFTFDKTYKEMARVLKSLKRCIKEIEAFKITTKDTENLERNVSVMWVMWCAEEGAVQFLKDYLIKEKGSEDAIKDYLDRSVVFKSEESRMEDAGRCGFRTTPVITLEVLNYLYFLCLERGDKNLECLKYLAEYSVSLSMDVVHLIGFEDTISSYSAFKNDKETLLVVDSEEEIRKIKSESILCTAVRFRALKTVEYLVMQKGMNINESFRCAKTPLLRALINEDFPMVRFMLRKSPDLWSRRFYARPEPRPDAGFKVSPSLPEYALKHRLSIPEYAFKHCSDSFFKKLASLRLDYECSETGDTSIFNVDYLKWLIKDKNDPYNEYSLPYPNFYEFAMQQKGTSHQNVAALYSLAGLPLKDYNTIFERWPITRLFCWVPNRFPSYDNNNTVGLDHQAISGTVQKGRKRGRTAKNGKGDTDFFNKSCDDTNIDLFGCNTPMTPFQFFMDLGIPSEDLYYKCRKSGSTLLHALAWAAADIFKYEEARWESESSYLTFCKRQILSNVDALLKGQVPSENNRPFVDAKDNLNRTALAIAVYRQNFFLATHLIEVHHANIDIALQSKYFLNGLVIKIDSTLKNQTYRFQKRGYMTFIRCLGKRISWERLWLTEENEKFGKMHLIHHYCMAKNDVLVKALLESFKAPPGALDVLGIVHWPIRNSALDMNYSHLTPWSDMDYETTNEYGEVEVVGGEPCEIFLEAPLMLVLPNHNTLNTSTFHTSQIVEHCMKEEHLRIRNIVLLLLEHGANPYVYHESLSVTNPLTALGRSCFLPPSVRSDCYEALIRYGATSQVYDFNMTPPLVFAYEENLIMLFKYLLEEEPPKEGGSFVDYSLSMNRAISRYDCNFVEYLCLESPSTKPDKDVLSSLFLVEYFAYLKRHNKKVSITKKKKVKELFLPFEPLHSFNELEKDATEALIMKGCLNSAKILNEYLHPTIVCYL